MILYYTYNWQQCKGYLQYIVNSKTEITICSTAQLQFESYRRFLCLSYHSKINGKWEQRWQWKWRMSQKYSNKSTDRVILELAYEIIVELVNVPVNFQLHYFPSDI
jgi:hypothetical protein